MSIRQAKTLKNFISDQVIIKLIKTKLNTSADNGSSVIKIK